MSWRTVVISSSAKLDYQAGFLVVRKEDTVKIHLSEISILLVESTAVSLTGALLSELVKQKIKVIFCDEKRNPSSELVAYYGCHDTSDKVKNQIGWGNDQKQLVWTEIVAEKIRKQAECLERNSKADEAKRLRSYAATLDIGDPTNREAHAAKVYFCALFGSNFTRSLDNSINAALNYGYGVILSAINREIVSNGYITQLGLFHENIYNPFNLGSDLMEPLRPIVDDLVFHMKPEKFEHSEKMKVLEVFQTEVIIAGRKELLINAIPIYCKSIFQAINERDLSLIKFYSYE